MASTVEATEGMVEVVETATGADVGDDGVVPKEMALGGTAAAVEETAGSAAEADTVAVQVEAGLAATTAGELMVAMAAVTVVAALRVVMAAASVHDSCTNSHLCTSRGHYVGSNERTCSLRTRNDESPRVECLRAGRAGTYVGRSSKTGNLRRDIDRTGQMAAILVAGVVVASEAMVAALAEEEGTWEGSRDVAALAAVLVVKVEVASTAMAVVITDTVMKVEAKVEAVNAGMVA